MWRRNYNRKHLDYENKKNIILKEVRIKTCDQVPFGNGF